MRAARKVRDARCKVPLRRLIRPTRLKTPKHRTALTARRLVLRDEPKHSLSNALVRGMTHHTPLTQQQGHESTTTTPSHGAEPKRPASRHYTKCPAPRFAVLHTVSARAGADAPTPAISPKTQSESARWTRAAAAALASCENTAAETSTNSELGSAEC